MKIFLPFVTSVLKIGTAQVGTSTPSAFVRERDEKGRMKPKNQFNGTLSTVAKGARNSRQATKNRF